MSPPLRPRRRPRSLVVLVLLLALSGVACSATGRGAAPVAAGTAVTVDVSQDHRTSRAPAPVHNDVLTVERPDPLTITFGGGRVFRAADASEVGFDAVGPNPDQIGEITVRFSGLDVDQAHARAQQLSTDWAPDKPVWLADWLTKARSTDPASLGPRPVGGTDHPVGGPGGPAASIEIVPSGDAAAPYFVELHFFWPDQPTATVPPGTADPGAGDRA